MKGRIELHKEVGIRCYYTTIFWHSAHCKYSHNQTSSVDQAAYFSTFFSSSSDRCCLYRGIDALLLSIASSPLPDTIVKPSEQLPNHGDLQPPPRTDSAYILSDKLVLYEHQIFCELFLRLHDGSSCSERFYCVPMPSLEHTVRATLLQGRKAYVPVLDTGKSGIKSFAQPLSSFIWTWMVFSKALKPAAHISTLAFWT